MTSQIFLDLFEKDAIFKDMINKLLCLAKVRMSIQDIVVDEFKDKDKAKIQDIEVEQIRQIVVNAFPLIERDLATRAGKILEGYVDQKLNPVSDLPF